MDFSSIIVGLDVVDVVGSIIAASVLIVTFGFTEWASKEVARFFGW